MNQFLTRILSKCISSWHVCSANESVPDTYAQQMNQFLTRMLSARISSYTHAQHFLKGPFQISHLQSVHTSDPAAYAQCTHQFRCVCSVHASVSDSYAQDTHQYLTYSAVNLFQFLVINILDPEPKCWIRIRTRWIRIRIFLPELKQKNPP
jgi:hypothetical protein